MKKTSLSDIADAVGVSKSLVSLVLNNRGDEHGINKDTQQKVREAAEKLNYSPNAMARGLRTGKTHTIGLITADIANPFFARMARSIEDFAITKDYHLLVSSSDERADSEIQLIEMMQNRQVDGLIISSTLVDKDANILHNLKKSNFPFVLIDRYLPDANFPYVVSDNMEGMKKLTQHLIDQHRKKIALFTLSPSYISSINDRILGYKEALQQNSLSLDEELIIEVPFDDIHRVSDYFDLLETKEVDAVITLNNSLAYACLKECKKRHIEIPKKWAFASFDNVDWFELSSPNITGVYQPINEMGQKAVEILLDKISGKTVKNSQLKLEVKLVVRESSNFS